jgi:hypothetical protein
MRCPCLPTNSPKCNSVAQTIFAPLFTGPVRVFLLLSSLLLLLLATQAGAQISGTVTHERNEVLPNAIVLLRR